MMQSEDDGDDERCLLSNKRRLEKDQEEDLETETDDSWRIWVISTTCLVLGFALGAFWVGGSQALEPTTPSDAAAGGLAPGVAITFEPNTTFTNNSLPDIDANWARIIPPGRGFVQVDSDGRGMKQGLASNSDSSETKVVSVFYQLQCLDLIRKGFALSVANPTEFLYVMPQRSRQWSHCLDYLRQAVMCAADRTLETVEGNRDTNGETLLKGADGWGATHACRDYKGVYDWAEKHRSADHVGIDSVD